MTWSSWSSFLHMGGYGFYVWGSFFMTMLCIGGELALLSMQKRTLFTQLHQIVRLDKQDQYET